VLGLDCVPPCACIAPLWRGSLPPLTP
jgi:hypothetical protein